VCYSIGVLEYLVVCIQSISSTVQSSRTEYNCTLEYSVLEHSTEYNIPVYKCVRRNEEIKYMAT
jgi:hypothetical protein